MKILCTFCNFEYWVGDYCRSCASSSKQNDPTPQQIQEACEEIRQSWSPDIEQRRRVGKGSPRIETLYVNTRINPRIIRKSHDH